MARGAAKQRQRWFSGASPLGPRRPPMLVLAALAAILTVGTGVLQGSLTGVAGASVPGSAQSGVPPTGAAPNGAPQNPAAQNGAVPSAPGVASAGTAAALGRLEAGLRGHTAGSRPQDTQASCTFNGIPGVANGSAGVLTGVTPGEPIHIVCSGFANQEPVTAVQGNPLYFVFGSSDELDLSYQPVYTTTNIGTLSKTFTVPNPFIAGDPSASCPPTADQVAESKLGYCFLVMTDITGNGDLILLDYAPPVPPPYTGMAATPDGGGYWITRADGHVSSHGDALSWGDLTGYLLNAPISHIVSTPDGKGYWLVAADGGTFSFGDAQFWGSMGGRALNAPVVDMAPTPDGGGYWLVASDGGIFAFGDARFYGSLGGHPLNAPVVGIASTPDGKGYWMVGTDGGIFAFGDAHFYGSTGNRVLNQPVNGMAVSPDGKGYWFVAADGGIFAYGDAHFHGSTGGKPINAPIVGMAADSATAGYWLVGADGGIYAFGAPFYGAG